MPSVNDYTWPDDLPDECPPVDAEPAHGRFFRFVLKATVTAKDFIRPIDRPNADFPPEQFCEAAALSLYADVADVERAQKLIPAFKKRHVAEGELEPHMGVIKNTPSVFPDGTMLASHHDWWLPVTYTDLPPFEVAAS